jgi:hypothetical protein
MAAHLANESAFVHIYDWIENHSADMRKLLEAVDCENKNTLLSAALNSDGNTFEFVKKIYFDKFGESEMQAMIYRNFNCLFFLKTVEISSEMYKKAEQLLYEIFKNDTEIVKEILNRKN